MAKAKKAPKKAAAKKAPARKAPAKRAPAKQAPAKKSPAKKAGGNTAADSKSLAQSQAARLLETARQAKQGGTEGAFLREVGQSTLAQSGRKATRMK